MKSHPIQPLETDEDGILRFKKNAIVSHLLDCGGIDLNALARMDFPREDREQFAQLIGYSLSGFGDLSYVSDETYETASRMAESDETPEQARCAVLAETISKIRAGLREAAIAAFHIHPEDLTP
ncbi:MAG: hypothetical protein QM680_01005 [Luteolibacter sp.]